MMQFENLKPIDSRTVSFTLTPTHVTYANTLRRLILTGVETVAIRADMTSTGSTTDVVVHRNDTPMTNEMLADRIGLLPIHVTDPLHWKSDNYIFKLNVRSEKDTVRYVKSADFKIIEKGSDAISAPASPEEQGPNEDGLNEEEELKRPEPTFESEKEKTISTSTFFPPNPITGDTCLIAILQPSANASEQVIEITAKATVGTGREHARFSSVSQCSYEYTVDTNEERIDEMFRNWLVVSKKISGELDKQSDRYAALRREFNTMQIKRCFMMNEKGEPYSFDFTVESVGILPIKYIVNRACEVGENMCSRYVNITNDKTFPPEITVSAADSEVVGYDFLVRGHDHTLGNLLQTWLTENLLEGSGTPRITFAGYKVPHPLRDEMVLRIGVEDGRQETACLAFAEAAKGCVKIFQEMRSAWNSTTDTPKKVTAKPQPQPTKNTMGKYEFK